MRPSNSAALFAMIVIGIWVIVYCLSGKSPVLAIGGIAATTVAVCCYLDEKSRERKENP